MSGCYDCNDTGVDAVTLDLCACRHSTPLSAAEMRERCAKAVESWAETAERNKKSHPVGSDFWSLRHHEAIRLRLVAMDLRTLSLVKE